MDVRVRVAVLGVDLEDERQLLHRADLLALPSSWLNSAADRPKMPRPAGAEDGVLYVQHVAHENRERVAHDARRVLAALLADAILDHAVAVGVLAR